MTLDDGTAPVPDLRRTTEREQQAIWVLVVVATIAGAFSSGAPTGSHVVDVLLRAGLAGAVTVAASRSQRWTWIILTWVGTTFGQGPTQFAALLALLAACGSLFMERRSRPLGAAIAAVGIQAVLRLPQSGPWGALDFHGATALLGLLAVVPVLGSGYAKSHRATRRLVRRGVLALAAAAAVALALFAGSALAAKSHVEAGIAASRRALTSTRQGEQSQAETGFVEASGEFRQANRLLDSWWTAPARAIPVVGYQGRALARVSSQGMALSDQAAQTVRVGNYHDLKYQDGAFNLALMQRLRQPLRDSVTALTTAQATLADLDSPWLLGPVQSRLQQFAKDIDKALPDAQLASESAQAGPGLLGGSGTRRYLVLFTTPAEARGLGGFIGDYAELTADAGRVRMTRQGPINDLITGAPPGTRHISGPPDYLRRYFGQTLADYPQDLTLSPDFPSVASVAAELYPQSGGQPVDGVFLVDPYALGALLHFTGPIHVDGLDSPLTPANAAQVLLKDQYLRFQRSDERNDMLRQATRLTFERLTTGSLPGPQDLARTMGGVVHQHRFVMWSRRPEEEALIRRIGADGAFPSPNDHDLVAVRTQNSGHNKIDLFQRRSTSVDVVVDPKTGLETSTVTVLLSNDAPAGGLPDYVIGNTVGLPTGTNKLTMSLYTPLDLVSLTRDGHQAGVSPETELGLRVYSTPVVLPPGTTTTVVVRLRGRVSLADGYQLVMSPQPLVNPETVHVTVRSTRGSVSSAEGLKAHGTSADGAMGLAEVAIYRVRFNGS